MKDILTEADIDFLVEQFYKKVTANSEIGHFFENTNWEHHLPIMKSFWYFIILDKPGFKGNIFDAHRNKHIKPIHFDSWLHQFIETINQNYLGPNAEKAIDKARELSALFSWKLSETEGKD